MIFIGGGGFGFVVLAFVLLLLVGGGDLFPLVFLLLFFALPFLVIRSMVKAARRSVPVRAGGWHTMTWPQPRSVPQPQPQPQWQAPQEPVLPRVSAADVGSLRDRLGHDVMTLQPGDDPVARQALADASERLSTSSTLLERATTDAQLRTAWLAAVEGLQAAKVVRRQLGLDPGPPIPSLPSAGPQLTRPTQLEVEGRRYAGSPAYEPGHPHWFPGGYYGGRHVPGGWYDAPFWPASLVLGSLGGFALGSLMAGAMFGDDLGAGLEGGGFDGGGDVGGFDGGGGDFGGFGGGGDWGSSGGDWGGGGAGGGGGGDFGGGGDW